MTILVPNLGEQQFEPFDLYNAPYALAVQAPLVEATISNNRFHLEPGIATSWEESNGGRSWTFHIRSGVKFQNGAPVTVGDVVFSLQDTLGKDALQLSGSGTTVALAQNTQSIKQVGADSVEITTKTPVPNMPYVMSPLENSMPGAIIPKAYFEKVGRNGYNRNPIGAGPFKVTNIVPGASITMARFDGYYLKSNMPSISQLVWRAVPDDATRVQALRAGQADLVEATVDDIDQIKSSGGTIINQPQANYLRFQFANCWETNLACHDQRVRLALDLAINKTELMGKLYGESWSDVGWTFISPSSEGYSAALKPRAFDPAEARSLLSQAGYPGGKGFPAITINTSQDPDIPNVPEVAELVAASWQKVLGIKVTVKTGDDNTVRAEFGDGKLAGGLYLATNQGRYDGSTSALSFYGGAGQSAISKDPKLIQAIQNAAAITSPTASAKAYTSLYQKLRDSEYEIGMGSLSTVWGAGPRITGWTPWPANGDPSEFNTITVKN